MGDVEILYPVHAGNDPPPWGTIGWKSSLLLGVVLTLIYLANGREIGCGDTLPAKLLPIAIIRGDGPYLDRFQFLKDPQESERLGASWSVSSSRGHIVSRYPVGSALLAMPFMLPQILAFDMRHPGWDRNGSYSWRFEFMAKNAASVIAALTGVMLLRLLQKLGLGRLALPTVLAMALGSNFWTVASQSLWQHGPAALTLILAMMLLIPCPVSRPRLVLAGLATAMMVACRPNTAIFAAAIVLWMAWHHLRDLPWFLVLLVPCGTALAIYNYYYLGAIEGGYASSQGLAHGVLESWTTNFREGAASTLLSPNRGLFIFCPWIILALATVPAVAERLRCQSLVCWLLWAIVPYFLMLSKYGCWWGGNSFGPRLWTEVIPLFAILLGFSLDWSWNCCRPVFWAFVVTIVYSVGVQLIGALCYPSSWNGLPINVDHYPARIWDWHDTELLRCLHEGALHKDVFVPLVPQFSALALLSLGILGLLSRAWRHRLRAAA